MSQDQSLSMKAVISIMGGGAIAALALVFLVLILLNIFI